ncbi:hypothetical protein E1B28_012140 [Marasmius oreades]|uniref:Homeobox domain-containing protein n=1 Tax=Marasmius oreades TaxID=181124 RepID=A0A9P7UNM4_9AGAR|nr:uncharacterized protein E1B28_012140 [Marasmius oreades]KAG7088115.1 hypothetical protein E1B28_012140 [Marasmius oreades]
MNSGRMIMSEIPVQATSAHSISSIPKKVFSVRASPQQLSILREAFAQSHTPQDLKYLATETGLYVSLFPHFFKQKSLISSSTEKWISGWLQRERRKLKKKDFSLMKEEFEDPSLVVTRNGTSEDRLTTDSEATDNPLSHSGRPPKKKAKTLRQKRSLIIKMEDIEDTLPLHSIPTSVSSARVLSGHAQSGDIVDARDQVHIPASTPSNPRQPPKRGRKKQNPVLTSKATTVTAEDGAQLKDARLEIVRHAESILKTLSPSESSTKVTDLKEVPESASMTSSTEPFFLDPLLPPTHLSRYQPTETVATNLGEVVPKPTLSGSSMAPSFTPLFPLPRTITLPTLPQILDTPSSIIRGIQATSNVHPHLQSRQVDVTPLSRPYRGHVRRQPHSHLNDCGQPKLEALPEVLNPNLTPLKHLTMLRKRIANGSLSMPSGNGCRNMMEVLLDERLTSDDPFQAAMGLVFLSRLAQAVRQR